MEKATQDKEVKAGNPPDNPDPNPNPQPDPAEELKAQNEQLKKQLADKDRFITDLNSEKATLETRLSQRDAPTQQVSEDIQVEAKQILEKAQLDPEAAGKDLANLIKRTTDTAQQNILKNLQDNLQPAIENNVYVAEVKAKNKEILDFFGEDFLAIKVNQKLQTKQSATFKDAVDSVVKEYRAKMESLKSNVPPTPPPPESQAEGGGNKPPEHISPPKVETQEEEIERRKRERQQRGL